MVNGGIVCSGDSIAGVNAILHAVSLHEKGEARLPARALRLINPMGAERQRNASPSRRYHGLDGVRIRAQSCFRPCGSS